MDKKITAIIVVIIVIIAAAAVYVVAGNGNGNDDNGSSVHAVTLNGVEATEDNVLAGTYAIQRNLIVCTLGETVSHNVNAFISWICSDAGQAILGEEFVTLPEADRVTDVPEPQGTEVIAIGGSTSITETMEALTAAYTALYPNITFTIQSNGSGPGANGTISGEYDIGMCSRDLSQSEIDQGLVSTQIGQDGVAVIVNIDGVENLTTEQVAMIYSGEITNWSEVGGPDRPIAVYSREDGSGTRDCFDTAMENAVEGWTISSGIAQYNSTNAIIGAVQTNYGSIGYISIGQLGKPLTRDLDANISVWSSEAQ